MCVCAIILRAYENTYHTHFCVRVRVHVTLHTIYISTCRPTDGAADAVRGGCGRNTKALGGHRAPTRKQARTTAASAARRVPKTSRLNASDIPSSFRSLQLRFVVAAAAAATAANNCALALCKDGYDRFPSGAESRLPSPLSVYQYAPGRYQCVMRPQLRNPGHPGMPRRSGWLSGVGAVAGLQVNCF